ncbi:MAG: hypothetical protein H6827_10775 [Planctomycetes bacterium]|nr:hypothetical protein [Planctomycetota bacterium]
MSEKQFDETGFAHHKVDACSSRSLVAEGSGGVLAENTLLRQKLDALAWRFFGKKSERLDPA